MAQGKKWTKEEMENIIQGLRPYLEMGLSRNKACYFTGLTPSTLSNWVKADESLGMKLTSWENTVNVLAIKNIVDAIKLEGEMDDDLKKENSWKWAERRMKEDFSLRTENTGADGKDLPTPIIQIDVSDYNSISEDNETEEED